MLCKLSLKNIQKSFKDYAIYFFTLILGVAIFYVFNAIDDQSIMMKVTENTRDIITLMTNMLSGVSVFVSFILGFLIIYASRFLMKRRNKEFGIYLTLGMSKRKISLILFLETLFIGIVSLVVGLGIGVILSQVMSILVANMFEADLTDFAFSFSKASCGKTLVYFGIIYFLVMIFNTVNVRKCKLIDLLHANKKSEKVKLKNPYLCIFVFVVSSCVLGYAYYLVTAGVDNLKFAYQILVPIVLGSVSTFFIFWSLSGLILHIVMRIKKLYYKGLNSFVLRQISSKINTTVMSMTVICLMLFVTICVLSSALSIKNSMTSNLKNLTPVDVEISKPLDLTAEKIAGSWNYNENMIDDSKYSVRVSLENLDFSVKDHFKDVLEFHTYATNEVTVKDTLGTYYAEAKKKYPFLRYDMAETFIRLSDYNKVAKMYGLEILSLRDNEYVLVADYESWIMIRENGLKKGTGITLLGKAYYPKYDHVIDGFYHISSNHINMGFFVVPDLAVEESIRSEDVLIANYKVDSEEEKEVIYHKILSLEEHPYIGRTGISVSSKLYIYEASVGLGAMVTFIGLYLGIIFLMSSAALLALKELSESSDNKERFQMLRKLGADEKILNMALLKQIAIFFLFPLLIAMIHSIFGIIFCNTILETFGNEQLLPSIIMTAIFIVIIYGGYFLITYLCSKNIIRER